MMTIVSLMNSCNADPDVVVRVYNPSRSLCYRGRYDEIPELYLGKEVDEFNVCKLRATDYDRIFITEMEIVMDESI